jgi:glycine cleavage system aminomethyltransferase T
MSKGTTTTRQDALSTWLDDNGARRLWHEHITDVGSLAAYQINGRVILVMIHRHRDGWEIYIPASDTNKVADTLDAAARYCGLAAK